MSNITGIILAAGTGSRLGEMTIDRPKALVEVAGKPLVYYAISHLHRIGVDRIIVIGGFCYEMLESAISKIDNSIILYRNDDYLRGNLYTLDVALAYVNTGFFLMNVDHIYRSDIAAKVRGQLGIEILAFTDNDRTLAADDMKVLADEKGAIRQIAKQLTEYTHGYVGKTFCPEGSLAIYKEAVAEAKKIYGDKAVVENVLQTIAAGDATSVYLGDISGSVWHEVDFPEEHAKANEAVLKNIVSYA